MDVPNPMRIGDVMEQVTGLVSPLGPHHGESERCPTCVYEGPGGPLEWYRPDCPCGACQLMEEAIAVGAYHIELWAGGQRVDHLPYAHGRATIMLPTGISAGEFKQHHIEQWVVYDYDKLEGPRGLQKDGVVEQP